MIGIVMFYPFECWLKRMSSSFNIMNIPWECFRAKLPYQLYKDFPAMKTTDRYWAIFNPGVYAEPSMPT